MGGAATVCYKHLASMLATKFDQSYSSTMNWLRCRFCFALLRLPIQCIRGARSVRGLISNVSTPPIDLVAVKFNMAF